VRYTEEALAAFTPGYREMMRGVCGIIRRDQGTGYFAVLWDGRDDGSGALLGHRSTSGTQSNAKSLTGSRCYRVNRRIPAWRARNVLQRLRDSLEHGGLWITALPASRKRRRSMRLTCTTVSPRSSPISCCVIGSERMRGSATEAIRGTRSITSHYHPAPGSRYYICVPIMHRGQYDSAVERGDALGSEACADIRDAIKRSAN
jgi:hypothetical protein